ncbi:MAG: sodium:calcium antiporter [Patescibacteria group bacterium]|nr:sodium:calcium antiporter [Patescibacteria group bacterium]
MLWFYILIFITSCLFLYFSGDWIIGSLMRMAKSLGWKEFVLSFFVMAFASSLPNFFLGLSSAFHKIPQLSFGDVVGGNVVDLTLAIALAVLFSRSKEIPAESRTVQTTSIFTMVAAILPLILVLDKELSRIDGVLLITFFVFYIFWLFSKKERFTKVYQTRKAPILKEFKNFLKDLGKVIGGIVFLLLASEGIVRSAQFFAQSFGFSLTLIGILIVGLGNALPETYFSVVSARKGESWMILGNLMGSIITLATVVLGTVALICPIKITDFSPFIVARIFLITSSLFFFFFVRTDRKITKKEATFLLSLYLLFVLLEILMG